MFTFTPLAKQLVTSSVPGWEGPSVAQQTAMWVAGIQSSKWWRERRQRDARFGFDPRAGEAAVGIERIVALRESVWGGAFIVHVLWSVPGTVIGQSLPRDDGAPHGDAYLYLEGFLAFSGAVSFEHSELLLEQDTHDPHYAALYGAMVGDDGRWVLFGTEKRTPEDERTISGHGWIAWFEGASLRVERRSCTIDIPQ